MGRGDFNNLTKFCEKMVKKDFRSTIEKFAEQGVEALRDTTPKDTGETANSWGYEIIEDEESTSIAWTNSRATKNGIPIVILLRWGHATGNGGYVQGRDFITPAIEPIFNRFTETMWKEVTDS